MDRRTSHHAGAYTAERPAGPVRRPVTPADGGSGRGRMLRPRQEYLDAFDGDWPSGASPVVSGSAESPAGAGAARRAEGGSGAAGESEGEPPRRGRHRSVRGRARARDKDRGENRGENRGEQRGRGRKPGGWGRSLSGVGAAAVVTCLAVTAAVALLEERPVSGDDAARGAGDTAEGAPDGTDDAPDPAGAPQAPETTTGPDGAADSAGAQSPGGTEDAPGGGTGVDYDTYMDTVWPMAPELTGSGTLVPVPGTDPAADPDAARLLRYRVDVEQGLGVDPEIFAEAVHRTLSDPRSWGNNGERGFARVADGDFDFIITLASPGTTAEWCAKAGLDTTVDNVSCNASTTERVMINAWRWAQGSDTFGPDRIREYRQMLVNHEVGHRIGYGHEVCPAEGALAPVMMQQTKFLTINGLTCKPNAWPHPDN
ncbi:DUF3152 domain-containing protein [Streptomyces aidingensis]|uniref:DUF3152 domain-containing protein n=1 Tax=Streptomyces aidingensis TaxID=910347 RepID=A0A1I1F0M7_9ACTN|nr:DUF3152 domain-containing protein [Streptomyces aidingensis]SFB91318.1 Protein of unknown function [Streptomyces aidingensis]